MATELPTTSPFYKRCAGVVAGISTKSYRAETSADFTYGKDECDEDIAMTSRNLTAKHSWSGEVFGQTIAGICKEVVGAAMAATPAFLWASNGVSDGTLITTRATYEESSSDYAKFSLDADQKPGI